MWLHSSNENKILVVLCGGLVLVAGCVKTVNDRHGSGPISQR